MFLNEINMNSKSLKLLLVSILYLFHLSITMAQTSQISGSVVDQNNNEPLIGASVLVPGKGVVTDFEGKFEIKLEPGDYLLEITYIGYETFKKQVTLADGQHLDLNAKLSESNTTLNTVTVTSGKYEKPLGEVTVSMEVIKTRLLEANNSTSVDEVLDKIPGVTLVDGQANIRGGSGWSYGAGSRVLLLVDDIPALQADAGFPNWDDIPVESVEQIEVVKGASSALYGSSALNGIINIRTAYAKSKPETKITTFYKHVMDPADKSRIWWDRAPFETGLSFSHKQKIKKLDLVLGGYGLYRKSVNETSKNRYGRISLNTRYRATDRLSFGVNANFNKGKSSSFFYWRDGESGAYRPDSTTLSNSDRFRYNIDPFVTYYDNSGNRHKLMARYYGIANDNDNNQSNGSDLLYSEYQFQRQMEEQQLVLTTGLVGTFSKVKSELYGDTAYTTNNLAAYLQVDKKLFDRLNLSFGTRYERVDLDGPRQVIVKRDTFAGSEDLGSKLVFRFGANYQAAAGTFLRASWGQGYRYPTIAEKYISTAAGSILIFPNPELDSESGWSAEIGVKQALVLGNWKGYFDIAGFWTEYQNMMEFAFSGKLIGFQSRNIGDTRIKGIDMTIAGEGRLFGNKTYLLAGYTYIDPRFKEFTESDEQASSVDYNILKYRFKHTAKMDLETHFNKVTVAVAGSYFSHMEAVDAVLEIFLPGVKNFRDNNQNGYTLLEARLGYDFNEHAKITLIGKNLTNIAYSDRPGLLKEPRSLTFRFDAKF